VYQTFEAGGLDMFKAYTPSTTDDPANHGKDSSTGIGLKFGWTGQMSKDLSFGAFYQPKTRMSKFDKYKYLFAEHGKFDIPASYGVGLSFAATPQTTLLFDIVQIDFNDVKSLGNKNNHNNANTKLGEDDGKGFGWKNMTVFKLGVRHQLNDKTTLRAGWNYGKQPIPGTELDFNLLAPAVVEHHLTLGFTHKLDANSEISAHFMHAMNKKLTGTTIANGAGANGGGTFHVNALEMKQNEIGIQYSWKY
jgi:long-chain fatty acid transport protein